MKKLLFAVAIAVTVIGTSCKKDASDAPTLPPIGSMIMDFEDFKEESKTDSTSDGIDTTKFDHWGRAAIQVGVWNTILTVNLAVPVLSFAESFNHTPTYVSKQKGWLWSYSLSNNSGTYTCDFYGKFNGNNETEWSMLISKQGGFQNVEWYTGKSKNDGTGGTWTLNKNALNVTPYLTATWEKDGNEVEVKYELIEETDKKGSYIEYGIEGNNVDFDRFYNIYGAKENYEVNIKWNKSTKAGQAKEPKFYLDDNYRCWDTKLKNTTCN